MKTSQVRLMFVILVALAGLAVIAGCSSSNSSNPISSTGSGGGGQHSSHFKSIVISGLAFSPATATVAVGDTVQWTNHDAIDHTVTSDTGSELQSPHLGQGETYQHIFTTAGTFSYHCSIHPTMHGSVTVQ